MSMSWKTIQSGKWAERLGLDFYFFQGGEHISMLAHGHIYHALFDTIYNQRRVGHKNLYMCSYSISHNSQKMKTILMLIS